MKSITNDLQPVRKIRPSSRSITGKFASKKNNTTHYFESTLERDYLTLLEFDPAVDRFIAQPLTIHFAYEGKIRSYTPDVLVYFHPVLNRKTLLIEIKYTAELETKGVELQPKFDAATRYGQEQNIDFHVVTEKDIRTDYLQNIKFLSRYRNSAHDKTIAEWILAFFAGKDKASAQTLLTSEDAHLNGRIIHTLWQLLSSNILMCDLHQKINMTTELWINKHQAANR